jgi:hypothetical protein
LKSPARPIGCARRDQVETLLFGAARRERYTANEMPIWMSL